MWCFVIPLSWKKKKRKHCLLKRLKNNDQPISGSCGTARGPAETSRDKAKNNPGANQERSPRRRREDLSINKDNKSNGFKAHQTYLNSVLIIMIRRKLCLFVFKSQEEIGDQCTTLGKWFIIFKTGREKKIKRLSCFTHTNCTTRLPNRWASLYKGVSKKVLKNW